MPHICIHGFTSVYRMSPTLESRLLGVMTIPIYLHLQVWKISICGGKRKGGGKGERWGKEE